jgi:hypothetical protein
LFTYLLLLKLLNGERAAMYAKVRPCLVANVHKLMRGHASVPDTFLSHHQRLQDFAVRMQRTRKEVLLNMQRKFFEK